MPGCIFFRQLACSSTQVWKRRLKGNNLWYLRFISGTGKISVISSGDQHFSPSIESETTFGWCALRVFFRFSALRLHKWWAIVCWGSTTSQESGWWGQLMREMEDERSSLQVFEVNSSGILSRMAQNLSGIWKSNSPRIIFAKRMGFAKNGLSSWFWEERYPKVWLCLGSTPKPSKPVANKGLIIGIPEPTKWCMSSWWWRGIRGDRSKVCRRLLDFISSTISVAHFQCQFGSLRPPNLDLSWDRGPPTKISGTYVTQWGGDYWDVV